MLDDVNDFARESGWLHAPALDYATYGVVLFGALLVAGWWLARDRGPRTMAASLWAGAATLIAVGVNQPLVHAFHERRPYDAHPGLYVLAHRSADFSFPSDHAVMAGAIAAGLWLVDRRLGVVAAVAAVLMAADRVYIAAHYPHDVLAGLAVGAAVALLGWAAVRRPLTRLVGALTGTAVRPLLASGPLSGPLGDAHHRGAPHDRDRRRRVSPLTSGLP